MFFERYSALCSKVGKSPNKVAKELSISSGSVTEWKKGRIPQNATLLKIANYFGVTTDYLLGRTDIKKERPQEKGVRVPVLGFVQAGIPMEAIENIIDYEEIPESMASHGEYFGLQVRGSSMEPLFQEGDVVIIRKQPDVDSGDIAVVLVNGDEATIKKIKKRPEGVMLIPHNPAFEPMFFSNQEILELPVSVLGKVVELRRKF